MRKGKTYNGTALFVALPLVGVRQVRQELGTLILDAGLCDIPLLGRGVDLFEVDLDVWVGHDGERFGDCLL